MIACGKKNLLEQRDDILFYITCSFEQSKRWYLETAYKPVFLYLVRDGGGSFDEGGALEEPHSIMTTP